MREIALDVETTGINRKGNVSKGHGIVEIGCVEIIEKRITNNRFHAYINPGIEITPKAERIHGITNDFIKKQPSFKDIAPALLEFIKGAKIVIHNAPFDTEFLNQEFSKLLVPPRCVFHVVDTLALARDRFPRMKNDLDSLSQRLGVNGRSAGHNALEDAEVLARVYLALI